MKRILDATHKEAEAFFLKQSSYFNGDFPKYISFETVLSSVSAIVTADNLRSLTAKPSLHQGVNYSFITKKDGRFAWRPYELIHPALYVTLVKTICDPENWQQIVARLTSFGSGVVECYSLPKISTDAESDKATQVKSWWKDVEQRSIEASLDYSHVLNTDVTDCYGSIYTHAIAWAIHGQKTAKEGRTDQNLIGNKIDRLIQDGRYGQTNGISQGSVLMDFIAEIVLGYVDEQISLRLSDETSFRIIRYRDDYRVFSNSDEISELVLKIISEELRSVGMKLGGAKTNLSTNVIGGSIKPDKIAGIALQDLGTENAKTIQKQLLRLHAFGRAYPNSGALRRLLGEFHNKISDAKLVPEDLVVQVAIATDIALSSPSTFPAIAGILSHLISIADSNEKAEIWNRVRRKMSRIPNNGYLEIWLQRVIAPKSVDLQFESAEPICRLVDGEKISLWENNWINSRELKAALSLESVVSDPIDEIPEKIAPEEIELFRRRSEFY